MVPAFVRSASPSALREVMAPSGFVFDYWNHFSNLGPVERGGSYFAVGNLGGLS